MPRQRSQSYDYGELPQYLAEYKKRPPLTLKNKKFRKSANLQSDIRKIENKGELSPILEEDETVTPLSKSSSKSHRSMSSKRSIQSPIDSDDTIKLKRMPRSTTIRSKKPRFTLRSFLKGIGNKLGIRTKSKRS